MKNTNTDILKEVRPHGSASFRCAFYQSDSEEETLLVKHHWHDEIEIIYFSKGNFHLEINMEHYDIHEECLYFVNSGELHYITCEGIFEEDAVVFNPYILSFESYDIVQSQLIRPMLNGEMTFPRYILSTDSAFPVLYKEYQRIREAFLELQGNEGRGHETERVKDNLLEESDGLDILILQITIKAALLNLLSYMTKRGLLTVQKRQSNQQIEEIKRILTYINTRYSDKIYIRDLAGLMNVNEQYFCRFFKKVIGKSPIEYVNEVRIKRSIELLTNTNMLVMDICLESGFNNLGNFLREFKKHTGLTPLAYKKSNLVHDGLL